MKYAIDKQEYENMKEQIALLLNELKTIYRFFCGTSAYHHLEELQYLNPLNPRQLADIVFIMRVEKELGIKDGLHLKNFASIEEMEKLKGKRK